MTAEPNRKKQRRGWVWLLAGLLLAGILAGLMVYRSDVLRGRDTSLQNESTRWTFEPGAQMTYAAAGGGVAIGSSTGLQMLDKDGYTAAQSVVSVTTPALTAAGSAAAVYDVGGTVLRLGSANGTTVILDTADAIFSAALNDSGWMALVTEETGYKGKVTVYNAEMEPVYYWHSGSSYVQSARVSPDCRTMAALTMDESGSAVHVFSLSSETEYAVYQTDGLLLFDLEFLGNDRLCAVHDGGLCFFTTGGADDGGWSFEGRYLSGYSFAGDGFVTVLLSPYLSGNSGEMYTVGYGGTVTGQLTMTDAVQNVSVLGKQVAVRYSDSAALYTQSLEEQSRVSDVQGAKSLVLTEKNRGFLVYSGYCEPLMF